MNRTFEYLWERHVFEGVFVIDVYKTLREKPMMSVAEIICDHLRGGGANIKGCRNTSDFVYELRNRKYLIGIENIDSFSLNDLPRGQRVDECILQIHQETKVHLVATMGSTIRNEHMPSLQKIPRNTMKLKQMTNTEIMKIFVSHIKN
ncbi:hypothetical protein RFI_33110, partial [Reticulomyxa filosa]